MSDRRFWWTGDLWHECHCEWHGYSAHCTMIRHARWTVRVDRQGANFNLENMPGYVTSGYLARAVCEQIMARAHAEAERDRLREVVDKLPTHADTGEPFVPGRDKCFVVHMGVATDISKPHWNGQRWVAPFQLTVFYSTIEAAAEAAKESEGDDAQ